MTNEDRLKIFAENLKFYMNRLGYTQKDIAEKLGVTQQAVNIWCTGKGSPRLDKAQTLAQLLNVKMTDLTEERHPKEQTERPDLQKLMDKLALCDKEQLNAIEGIIDIMVAKNKGKNRPTDER